MPVLHKPLHLAARTPMLLVASLAACLAPRDVAVRDADVHEHGTAGLAVEERAELWVSYQIEVTAVDGEPTDYRARRECVYYLVALPPGEHELAVRLSYSTPVHRIATADSLSKLVRLEPGRAYRLLDLSSGEEGERRFTPWLVEGAPESGSVSAGDSGSGARSTAPALASSITAPPSEGE